MGRYSFIDYKKTLNERDSWWRVLVIDPIIGKIVPFIANSTSITPNQLTLVSFGFALLAAVFFLGESYYNYFFGAIFFFFSFLFDCLDGSLARIKGIQTKFGAMLDLFTDFIGITAVVLSLGISEWQSHNRYVFLLITLIFTVGSFYYRITSAWLQYFLGTQVRKSTLPYNNYLTKFLKKYRLSTFPTTVEAETAALVIGPILHELLIGLTLGAVIILLNCLRNTYKLFVNLKGL